MFIFLIWKYFKCSKFANKTKKKIKKEKKNNAIHIQLLYKARFV